MELKSIWWKKQLRNYQKEVAYNVCLSVYIYIYVHIHVHKKPNYLFQCTCLCIVWVLCTSIRSNFRAANKTSEVCSCWFLSYINPNQKPMGLIGPCGNGSVWTHCVKACHPSIDPSNICSFLLTSSFRPLARVSPKAGFPRSTPKQIQVKHLFSHNIGPVWSRNIAIVFVQTLILKGNQETQHGTENQNPARAAKLPYSPRPFANPLRPRLPAEWRDCRIPKNTQFGWCFCLQLNVYACQLRSSPREFSKQMNINTYRRCKYPVCFYRQMPSRNQAWPAGRFPD